AGAIRADSVEDMLDICKALCLLPEAGGEKLAIITNSGGPGVMSADATEGSVLTLPEPSEETKNRLREFLPSFAGLANPIDVTVEGTDEQYEKSTQVMLEEYDLALVIDIGTPYLKALPIAEGAIRAAKASGKPVACNFEVGEDIEEAKELLDESGAPCFASAERAVRALSKVAEYARLKKSRHYVPETFEEKHFDVQPGRNALLEYESMDLLGGEGVSVPKHRFVTRREDVVEAAHEIGYPLVLKVVSPQILHKSDFGGVKLNLASDEAVLAAFDEIAAMAADKDFRGVILYPMLAKAQEMIVGFSRDAQFGPVVICGMGGIYTEILKDISLRVAPVSKEDALEMLHELKTWPLLAGARGQEPADVEGLAELIHRFSQLPFIYPQLKEGELNPVFVYPDRVEAADARIILQ
ncbi:MAG: acetate--CoA ligase family protein, partial [Lachnospiraceae bacterium]|nr:acetate--CoA ligase family protein [Lachnospiraceae bacterium]